jgi:hypothetical protein
MQRPQTLTVQDRARRLLARGGHNIGGVGTDRARAAVREPHHEEDDSVHSPEPHSGQQAPKQRVLGSHHSHLTRQRRTQMLQSLGVTPGTGKTHLATGLGIAAAHHGHRVLFATATDWVTRLTDAHRAGRLPAELTRLRRYGLIIIDEVGYLPFEQDAANLFFQLVSSRYEHASLILTSNLPFSGWGGVFGDQAVAAAMIDRVVHHADVLTLKGASYRLRNRGIDTLPSIRTQNTAD